MNVTQFRIYPPGRLVLEPAFPPHNAADKPNPKHRYNMIAKLKKLLALATLAALGAGVAIAGSYSNSWSSGGSGFYQINDSVTVTAAGSAAMGIDSNTSGSFLIFQALGQVSSNGNPTTYRSGAVAAGTYSVFGILSKTSWGTPTTAYLDVSW